MPIRRTKGSIGRTHQAGPPIEPGIQISGRGAEIRAKPVRHPGQWLAIVILAVLAAMAIHAIAFARVKRGNSIQTRFGWDVVGQFFLTSQVIDALFVTLELTVIAMVIGVLLGTVLAVMRLSENGILSSTSWLFIWFFRGTPVLVQLLFWYNISYLFPTLSIGLPFGRSFATFNANNIVTPFVAALVGLGLNEAAYMAEIVRAGILSVDSGQGEAAKALGMWRGLVLRRIVLPQAMRFIIPPTGNQVIGMLKESSLASVITVTELLNSVELVYSRTFQPIPLLIVASLWYLAATSVFTAGQYYVERYFSRGSSHALPSTPLQKLRRILGFNKGAGLPPLLLNR